jgi:hypothetical protein
VFEPEVSVGPLTVIAKPAPALVEAAICEVVVAVSVGENNWLKLTVPGVAVAQSGKPETPFNPTVAPAQKTSDSGIVPSSIICVAVAAATVPWSIAVPEVSIEAKVDIQTKKVWLVVVGFVTPENS